MYLSSTNAFIFRSLAVFFLQQIHICKPLTKPPQRAFLPRPFFLRPEPRDGYAFSRLVESRRSSERISFQSVRGRCGDFSPLGWVAENLKGSKRGRDAKRPSPQIERMLTREQSKAAGGLRSAGESILFQGFLNGAVDVGILISLRAVYERGCRGMGPNGIANFNL